MIDKSFFYLFILLITFIFGNVSAQTTGKIAGRVTEKDTGEPIAGANIVIEDQQKGAATDLDGEFFIVNIPPGTYNISASMIGF